ncbi:MAG: hypothetical protein E7191_07655 [Erysipelotrichaceae bacterium]|nr:hypothetical protein [Erysipelotrichaceae bacterium]
MGGLGYLFFTKIKAMIRNIFSSPLSGIFTFLGVLVFGLTFVLTMIMQEDLSAMGLGVSITSMHMLVTTYIGVIFFFMGVMVLQKHTALMFKADAFYLLSGPFTHRMILRYINIENIKGAVLYGLFATWYLACLGSTVAGLTLEFLVLIFIQTLIMLYVIISLISYFYLLEITDPRVKKIKIAVFITVILYIAALFAKSYLTSPNDILYAVQLFLSDPLFYCIPLFGFAKFGLMGYLEGSILAYIISFVLNTMLAIILVYLIEHVKGDFSEAMFADAQWIDDVRKRAKQGKTRRDLEAKVYEVKDVKMHSGARAIASKLMLELRKTRSFIRKQEAGLMLFYLAIAYFIGMDFTFFQYYILIILMGSASSDYIIMELKKPYIYLIPDSAGKKMLYLLQPLAMKMVIIVFFGLTCGFIVFRPSLFSYVSALFSITSYGIMFTAGSIWSIRLMKSGNNGMAEHLIKMLIILIACIPTIIATVAVVIYYGGNVSNEILMGIISAVSVVCNMLTGLVLIYVARSILNGAEVMSE